MLIIRYLIIRLITRAEEGFSKLRHGEIVSSLAMQHVQCAHYCCTAILVTSLPPSRLCLLLLGLRGCWTVVGRRTTVIYA